MEKGRDHTVAHYDEQWESMTTEDVLKRITCLDPVLRPIASKVAKEGARVLDLGCGPATLGISIAREVKVGRVVGVDLSEKALALGKDVVGAQGLDGVVELVNGDMAALPFGDGSFDAVVSSASLNLARDKAAVFSEAARVLKQGGVFVFGDAVKGEGSEASCGEKAWDRCVSGAPSLDEIWALAEKVGLTMIGESGHTEDVRDLVLAKLWDWPEFNECGMEYWIFHMGKM